VTDFHDTEKLCATTTRKIAPKKDIYEGDILRDTNGYVPTHAIEFENGRFGYIHCKYAGCGVIGNIYENPEPLNQSV